MSKIRASQAITLSTALALVALAFAPIGSAGSRGGFVDEVTISHTLESRGFSYGGRHVNVDNGFCLGLRRFGVRTADYIDSFTRFKCTASGADNHMYTVNVSITR